MPNTLKQTLPFGSFADDAGCRSDEAPLHGARILPPQEWCATPGGGPVSSPLAPHSEPWGTGVASGALGAGGRLPEQQAAGRPFGNNWEEKGRAICNAIQQSLSSPNPEAGAIEAIERAYAAWCLDGFSERDIATVAHVCDRAHEAIRRASSSDPESEIHQCAEVLHHRLPHRLRERLMHEDVVRIVRELRRESIRLRAVTLATMDLLGWVDLYRGRAERLIQAALRDFAPKCGAPGR